MVNKKIGNDFEKQFCQLLSDNDFWVHNLSQNSAGQPADVIAVKNSKAFLIDCKVCSKTKRFPLSRVEENQHFAMERWKECGNGEGQFAILMINEIFMISHDIIQEFSTRTNKSYINERDISLLGTPFATWVKGV